MPGSGTLRSQHPGSGSRRMKTFKVIFVCTHPGLHENLSQNKAKRLRDHGSGPLRAGTLRVRVLGARVTHPKRGLAPASQTLWPLLSPGETLTILSSLHTASQYQVAFRPPVIYAADRHTYLLAKTGLSHCQRIHASMESRNNSFLLKKEERRRRKRKKGRKFSC